MVGNFIAFGSGTVFSMRVRIQENQINADPVPNTGHITRNCSEKLNIFVGM